VRRKRAVTARKLENYPFTLMYDLTIVLARRGDGEGEGGRGDERKERKPPGANKYHQERKTSTIVPKYNTFCHLSFAVGFPAVTGKVFFRSAWDLVAF